MGKINISNKKIQNLLDIIFSNYEKATVILNVAYGTNNLTINIMMSKIPKTM